MEKPLYAYPGRVTHKPLYGSWEDCMGRPRKGEPRPDTALVAFRLPRAMLQAIDEHAKRTSTTRTGAARDLVQRGLGTLQAAFEKSPPPEHAQRSSSTRMDVARDVLQPEFGTQAFSKETPPPKAVANRTARKGRHSRSTKSKGTCGWCRTSAGEPHLERCPVATGSLNGIFGVAARAAARNASGRPEG